MDALPRRLLRAAALFALACACFVFVVFSRWTPCASDLHSLACGRAQDDSYDAALRAAMPASPQLWALLIGYALLGVGLVMVGRAAGSRTAWLCALLGASAPWFSALSYAAPNLDAPSPWDGILRSALIGTYALAGPLAFVTVLPAARHRVPWSIAFGAAVGATSLLVDFFIAAPILNGFDASWDTTPWTWASTAVGAGSAAVILVILAIMSGSIASRAEPAQDLVAA